MKLRPSNTLVLVALGMVFLVLPTVYLITHAPVQSNGNGQRNQVESEQVTTQETTNHSRLWGSQEISQKLQEIALGEGIDQVTARLGAFHRAEKDGAIFLSKDGMTVVIKDNIVASISMEGPECQTPEGVKIGDTYGRLWDVYGRQSLVVQNPDGQSYDITYDRNSFEFGATIADEGKIVALWKAVTAQPAIEVEYPSIHKVGREYRLLMPEHLWAMVNSRVEGFVPWRQGDFVPWIIENAGLVGEGQAPFAVVQDFNRDKKPDVAVLGHSGEQEHLIFLVSNDDSYHLQIIFSGNFREPEASWYHPMDDPNALYMGSGFQHYLKLLPAGQTIFNFGKHFKLDYHAVEFSTFGKGGTEIYYVENNEIRQYDPGPYEE